MTRSLFLRNSVAGTHSVIFRTRPPDPAESLDPSEGSTKLRDNPVASRTDPAPPERSCGRIDIADEAYSQSNARTMWRVHRKLQPFRPAVTGLYNQLLEMVEDRDADLRLAYWKELAHALGCRSR